VKGESSPLVIALVNIVEQAYPEPVALQRSTMRHGERRDPSPTGFDPGFAAFSRELPVGGEGGLEPRSHCDRLRSFEMSFARHKHQRH
jgi:hypothetical protein